jgi:hypothetical protein
MKWIELTKKNLLQVYWSSKYNRLERNFGWILISIGALILLIYGGYKIAESLVLDLSITLLLKIGVLVMMIGLVILLLSSIREQLFLYKRKRHKDIER